MFIRQNDTGSLRIGRFVDVTDGATPETGITLGAADAAYAVLGDDTEVDISGYTWTHRTNQPGVYDLTLQTGITDTIGMLEIYIHDTSVCLPVERYFYVVEETVYDALYAASSAGFGDTSTITMSEPSQGAPPIAPTPFEALMYMYLHLVRNKRTTDSSDHKIFADDGTTVLYKQAVSDAAGTLTVAEAVTGP